MHVESSSFLLLECEIRKGEEIQKKTNISKSLELYDLITGLNPHKSISSILIHPIPLPWCVCSKGKLY